VAEKLGALSVKADHCIGVKKGGERVWGGEMDRVAKNLLFVRSQHASLQVLYYLKGTIRPEWICMRVVPLDRP
jgi:hypothetical protein